MLLTVTVNRRNTFKSTSIAHAKQQASRLANKHARRDDWARIYVSSGPLKLDGKQYESGSELWLRRFNQMHPYKPGKWTT